MKSQEYLKLDHQTVIWILLALCLLTNAAVACAGTGAIKKLRSRLSFAAAMEYVLDGDSLVIRKDTELISIRLWGIDAPEFDQPFTSYAKDQLEALTSGKRLTIFPRDIDRYGRLVAVIAVDDIIINQQMVMDGYAWVHVYYCDSAPCSSWFELEKRARAAKKGLWRSAKPIEPWVWKREK